MSIWTTLKQNELRVSEFGQPWVTDSANMVIPFYEMISPT